MVAVRGKVDAEDALDVSRADRGIWLLKAPAAIAEQWRKSAAAAPSAGSGGGVEVGRLRLSFDLDDPSSRKVAALALVPFPLRWLERPNRPRHTSLPPAWPPSSAARLQLWRLTTRWTGFGGEQYTLELKRANDVPGPRQFLLHPTDPVPIHVFSESEEKVVVEGKVEHKFDLQTGSADSQDYRALVRSRFEVANKPKRVIQMLGDEKGPSIQPAPLTTPLPISKAPKRLPAGVKVSDMKRVRMDRDQLEARMFALFERQANWNLKQLTEATDQPTAFLKDILTDLCVYNKRGVNQGTYELKPEYKRKTEDFEAS
eukprot:SM000003S10994  [mRNA]  locus=s3:196435:198581:+ [translate_table: standard]